MMDNDGVSFGAIGATWDVQRVVAQTLAKINRKRLHAKPMDGYGLHFLGL